MENHLQRSFVEHLVQQFSMIEQKATSTARCWSTKSENFSMFFWLTLPPRGFRCRTHGGTGAPGHNRYRRTNGLRFTTTSCAANVSAGTASPIRNSKEPKTLLADKSLGHSRRHGDEAMDTGGGPLKLAKFPDPMLINAVHHA
jgi:hypothetical protein